MSGVRPTTSRATTSRTATRGRRTARPTLSQLGGVHTTPRTPTGPVFEYVSDQHIFASPPPPAPTTYTPLFPPPPWVRVEDPPLPPLEASSSSDVVDDPTNLTLPSTNPYYRLPRAALEAIAQERDFAFYRPNRRLDLSFPEMIEQLFQFDHILPEWMAKIQARHLGNFQTLTLPQLYVFGALHNVNFTGIPTPAGTEDLVGYIRVAIALQAPDPLAVSKLGLWLRVLRRDYLEHFAVARLGRSDPGITYASDEMLFEVLINNNVAAFDFDALRSAMERFEIIRTHRHRDILGRLYGIADQTNQTNAWRQVVRKPPHPMEQVIVYLDSYTSGQITKTFGMVVPLSYTGRVEVYIRENIYLYASLLTRPALLPIPLEALVTLNKPDLNQLLNSMSDNEIHTYTGIYVPYQGRRTLIHNTVKAVKSPKSRFMYPCVRSTTRSINATTILFTDITDTQTFMVCYGTAARYYSYELQELIGAFHLDERTGLMEFRRPEAPARQFTMGEVEGLKDLLRCFDPTPEIGTLIGRIDQGLIFAREKTGYDATARTGLGRLSAAGKNCVREFLRQLFHIGMYMRRWQGPGYPYPLRESDTKREWDPIHKVQDELLRTRDALDQMGAVPARYCMGLRMCEYKSDGSIEQHSNTLEIDWTRVVRGEFCIRMASSKFVGTSLHFLRVLFHENIEGVDTTTVARIV